MTVTPANFSTGGRVCYATHLEEYSDYFSDWTEEVRIPTDAASATLISSKVVGSDKHKPVIDIDVPIRVYPSSTLGHFHLYIDKEISWFRYKVLLWAMVKAGIVEEGYLYASKHRKATHVRLPWVHK